MQCFVFFFRLVTHHLAEEVRASCVVVSFFWSMFLLVYMAYYIV